MAKTEHYFTRFEQEKYYHVYNRTVDRKPMFVNNGNYEFFLSKYSEYISQVADTYAYCLLGNHFHLLIRVKSISEIEQSIMPKNGLSGNPDADINLLVSRQFRKFFQSYAMAFNKQQDRIGTLFQTPFKRVCVEDDLYFTHLVYYIHANPQLHGLVSDFHDWHWSSYNGMLTDKPTKLQRSAVLNWFGGKDKYVQFHESYSDAKKGKRYFIEDETN